MVDVRKARVYNDIYQELEELAMKDPRLTDAFSAWEELSQTPESIIAYEARLKKIIDDEAKIDYARHKGEEKGLEKGLKRGRKEGLEEGRKEGKEEGKEEGIVGVILQGAKKGLDIAILSQITGFSEERVEEILKENPSDQLEN